MTILAGAKVDAVDFDLPDVVTAFGNGTNTVTATSFSVLPTTTCTAVIVNSHPSASMLTLVSYGAWMAASTANDVRAALDFSGATVIAPGIGGGAAVGWGEIPLVSTTTASAHQGATITVELAPGTTTVKMYAYRSAASGTHTVNYPTIRLVPLRYLF